MSGSAETSACDAASSNRSNGLAPSTKVGSRSFSTELLHASAIDVISDESRVSLFSNRSGSLSLKLLEKQ
jgi:hypothetical protein